eukprot:7389786-Prymnesium_polylepis.1
MSGLPRGFVLAKPPSRTICLHCPPRRTTLNQPTHRRWTHRSPHAPRSRSPATPHIGDTAARHSHVCIARRSPGPSSLQQPRPGAGQHQRAVGAGEVDSEEDAWTRTLCTAARSLSSLPPPPRCHRLFEPCPPTVQTRRCRRRAKRCPRAR